MKKSSHILKDLFKFMEVSVIITNYRIIFEPVFKLQELEYFFGKQPSFVTKYFEVPLGQVSRCEKQLNPVLDQNQ